VANQGIASHLLSWMEVFLERHPDAKTKSSDFLRADRFATASLSFDPVSDRTKFDKQFITISVTTE
jgi:hypothetical protein